MNDESGRMTVMKKEELQKSEERSEKSHRQGQEGISRRNFRELDVMICCTSRRRNEVGRKTMEFKALASKTLKEYNSISETSTENVGEMCLRALQST
jgi:hypothetical protein